MADLAEFTSWLKQLECPQSFSTDYVKNAVHRGVLGLLWEDLPKVIRPVSEVSEIRKNILLYKLKNESQDRFIQTVRNNVNLKDDRIKLNDKSEKAEEEWRLQEFKSRQKAHMLEKKKAERQRSELKKEILKIKREQMLEQIKHCAKMQEVCEYIMPPNEEDVPQSTIFECLSLVSNYTGGPEKRNIWNQISKLLSPIKVPVLWNALLAARSHYTDFLIHLDVEEKEDYDKTQTVANVDIGIAKLCSEHLNNVANTLIHESRAKNNQSVLLEYVHKIEQAMDAQNLDLQNWLPLKLEVRKLETLHVELQKELEKLEEQIQIDNIMVDDVMMQLIGDIKDVDIKIVDCSRKIHSTLTKLKTSRDLILHTRECLSNELEKLHLLETTEETKWSDIDLNTELILFHNDIDLDSLRKVVLKDETGIYKHLQMCFNKANTSIDFQNRNQNLSNFPMLQVPLYYLIDLYKTFIANSILNKHVNEDILDINDDILEQFNDLNTSTADPSYQGLFELLRIMDVSCKKSQQHSEEFERLLKAWSNQTVREVVFSIFGDKTVYGATLDEWQKRFSMIVYVLQKSNINAA